MRKQINKQKRNKRSTKNQNANNNNLDQQQNVIAVRRNKKTNDTKIKSKYFYDYGGSIGVVFNGSIAQIITPKLGLLPDERVGNKILVKRIEMKYVMNSPPSDLYNHARIMIVYTPQGTALPLTSIIDGNPATGGMDPLSFPKPYSTGTTHQILYDQTHIMNVNSSNSAVHGQVSIPCNLPSSWDYTQNFESGYFSLVLLGDSSFIPHCTITYNIRSQYVDL